MTDFDQLRRRFVLPEGVIYLDGNSLGPLPLAAQARMARTLRDEWGEMLITGWNQAGWMEMPRRVGDRIARLIGAPDGSVVVGDTLSIKVYQALHSAIALRPGRRVILSDTGNFPSDLYMAQGLIETCGRDLELRLVDPDEVADAIDDDLAVLLLTEVDYKTGRRHDMPTLTTRAHDAGALAIWDRAHSAGAFPVDVVGGGADFAVGCTYKFLNAGPGAPAFIYAAPEHQESAMPALAGWMGHEAPFAFETDYRPGHGIERMRVGTPPILQLSVLDVALDIWDDVDLYDLRARSVELSERFISQVEAQCPDVSLVSPRNPARRGSQVSFRHDHGYAIVQALIAEGVIGDFRAPDVMRFGITPLYLRPEDVDAAVAILAEILRDRSWDREEFHARKRVT